MNCIFLRRGYPEIETGPDYSDNFADNDWATIAAVCAAGLVPVTWAIGDQKEMTINGTSYAIDIIGIQHDDYADGSGKAPFTFQMNKCYTTGYPMRTSSSNSGGWNGSTMRTSTLPNLLALMPSEAQAAIREVNKVASTGYQSTSVKTSADKLFLLSYQELFGDSTTAPLVNEGTQYKYYADGNSKSKTSASTVWWTRSATPTSTSAFCCCQGGTLTNKAANQSYAVAFAFCF